MDVFDSDRLGSNLSNTGPIRRHASRQSLSARRSHVNLRNNVNGGSISIPSAASFLAPSAIDNDDDEPRHGFSLAHELAAALMPEPSAGSKLLADEFGLEFDEGAEGIDHDPQDIEITVRRNNDLTEDELSLYSGTGGGFGTEASFGDSEGTQRLDDNDLRDEEQVEEVEAVEHARPISPLKLLERNLEATDVFLSSLRRLDTDPSPQSAHILSSYPGSNHEPPLERVASHIIRRINDIEREREGQVRELRGVERELKRIAGEVGGNDILGSLDELECVEGLIDEPRLSASGTLSNGQLESPVTPSKPHWLDSEKTLTEFDVEDLEGEADGEDDEDDEDDEDFFRDTLADKKDAHLRTPPTDPPTLTNTLSHLVHARMLTQSLVTSLIAISEHAQVNGAATAEAGRKLRALKNKIGGWRADWESAERSREKIARWEAGGDWDDETPNLSEASSTASSPTATPVIPNSRRIDGRRLVEQELSEFAVVLAGVGTKAKAIMAS
ncbi:hypothetical protein BOTBODRAFT_63059 [Botryobasidium botryosum FD-172 SS1]|uniref:Uncharacterized protein n=1 Tax=Botryobasidium botryosum (strain FD-172 SS1) TaxID=930990 RepID=A0A067MW25_BOTB1|nr:hypothetical protein BOTBODRAFT_63059 [Botryobasidium botryosum FD-172 SS1]